MDGTNKFVFKQINPVKIEIKKVDKRITYKKGNAEPLTIDGLSDDIFFLFNYDSDNLGAKYNITRKYINNKEVYNIIPKEKKNIKHIILIAFDDKIEKIKIIFNDKSNLIYEFKNTITGIKPDEKYF